MALRDLHTPLMATIETTKAYGCFHEARARHDVLAPYESIVATLPAFRDESDAGMVLRDRLTAAMIHEARRGRPNAEIWNAALILAYEGMLVKMRRRLIRREHSHEDLDQMIILAFLATADELEGEKLNEKLLLHLKEGTRRKLERQGALPCDPARKRIEAMRAYLVALKHAANDEVVHDGILGLGRSPKAATDEAALRLRLVRCLREQKVPQHRIDDFLSTMLDGEEFEDYARRMSPTATEGQVTRRARAIKTDRDRLLDKLYVHAPDLKWLLPEDEIWAERCAV